MTFQLKFEFLVLLLTFNVFKSFCAPKGVAIFNNTNTGLNGTITLRHNPVFGSYLIGQIRNIKCFNASSATLNPLEAAPINSCMLGLTINTWRNNTNDTLSFRTHNQVTDKDSVQREWRQTIFNMSNIKLPDIKEILSGSYSPFPNLFKTTTAAPSNSGVMSMQQSSNQTNNMCANVGEVYNPNRDIFSGVLGFISPPGVIGNLMVSNGTGSILMGPLEIMTAGPASVIGLPLVLWMDSIRPVVNGTTVSMNRDLNDRILDCAIINAN